MAPDASKDPLPHPYLQALLVAGVPGDEVLRQGESLRLPPAELRAMADHMLACGPRDRHPAVVALLLGTLRRAGPFLGEGRNLGLRLLLPLLSEDSNGLDPVLRLLGRSRWEAFRNRILRRLGYPSVPRRGRAGTPVAQRLLPWLEADRGLVEEKQDLRGAVSNVPTWRNLVVDRLTLADLQGPLELGHGAFDTWRVRSEPRTTRLFRVSRLRALTGLREVDALVAVGCPELETLDATPPALVLQGCPALRTLSTGTGGRLLHVEDCAGFRSIGPEPEVGSGWTNPCKLRFGNVRLIRCPEMAELPASMYLAGSLLLREIGPIRTWPEDLHVGGDLRLRDCPRIHELPPMIVEGSLRVEGASGLRRLAPGTVVGRHLDLRACRELEDLPWGVKVGGSVFLPAHLHRQAPVPLEPEPLLEVPEDRYPALRTLLLGLKFPGLARCAERAAARDEAEAALAALRRELRENPRLESELLWTASEVWRDLAEAWWAEQNPWEGHANDSDEDLPLAWFRGLLLAG
jgi:hypothetical protein